MRLFMRDRRLAYRYITFAAVDRGLLNRLLLDERYQVPSVDPDWRTAGITFVYDGRRRSTNLTGVIQGVVAGTTAHLDQLAQDTAAVFAMTPLWRTDSDARSTFKRLESTSLRQSLAGLAAAEAGRALGDAILAGDHGHEGHQRAEETRLIERSRAAYSAALDLDELAIRCLREPGEHDETELSGLRSRRKDLGATIQDIQGEYAKLGGDEIRPL